MNEVYDVYAASNLSLRKKKKHWSLNFEAHFDGHMMAKVVSFPESIVYMGNLSLCCPWREYLR